MYELRPGSAFSRMQSLPLTTQSGDLSPDFCRIFKQLPHQVGLPIIAQNFRFLRLTLIFQDGRLVVKLLLGIFNGFDSEILD